MTHPQLEKEAHVIETQKAELEEAARLKRIEDIERDILNGQILSGVGMNRDTEGLVPVDPAASYSELAEWTQTVLDYVMETMDAMKAQRSQVFSGPVGRYGKVAIDLAEVREMLNTRSYKPKVKWRGFELDNAQAMRDDYARVLSRLLAQLKINRDLAPNLDLFDKHGEAAHWLKDGLYWLLTSLRGALDGWGQLLAWYDIHDPTGDDETIEAQITRVVQQ